MDDFMRLTTLAYMCEKFQKKNGGKMKIFLESQKYTSKLSGNVFWDRWDHLVAQKSKKCDFFMPK